MKAYMVEGSDPDRGADIVWAENRNEARSIATTCDCCSDDRYIDIRATRAQLLDNMENEVPFGHKAWEVDGIRMILVRDYNWACIDPWNRQECETCVARQWCHWMEE